MSAKSSPTPGDTLPLLTFRNHGPGPDIAATRSFRANPVRRYLLTVGVSMLLPMIVLAWLLGSFVVVRITEHIAQAGSAEIAANVSAVLRQSGLGMESAGESVVVRDGVTSSLDQWQYFTTIVQRNPNTVGVLLYDSDATIAYADDRTRIGVQPTPDAALKTALAGQRATRVASSLFSDPGSTYAVLVPLIDGQGNVEGVVEVEHDIGPLRQDIVLARWLITLGITASSLAMLGMTIFFTTRLARRSYIDPVTKLPNYSYLESASRVVLKRNAKRGKGAAVVLLDVDRFKLVNDTLGRIQGDRMLRDLADRLREVVRSGDYVARLGGDEFAVLLSGADEATTHAAIERVVGAVARPFEAGGRDIRLEASAGVALFPRDGVDLDSLLQRAEMAMYRAKELRLPVSYYLHDSDPAKHHSLYLESDLRAAVERDELKLVYQPVCHLQTGEIVGLESLMRWNHPVRGVVSPALFIPVAEESGFINRLDMWALKAATLQLAEWVRLGSTVMVSVNLSAQSVSDNALPEQIAELLRETGAPPEKLVLEITERSALYDIESSAGILERIRETGVRIALDDFGRGYSSLGTLENLPITFLKLDAGFTRGIGIAPKDEHLIRAINIFAKGMGIPFVTEGIENEEQRRWLINEGVRYGQGFLFARPVTAADVILPFASGAGAELIGDVPFERGLAGREPN
ncbi:MAG TPA: bifunctional diguanylate cyclase/phosphodiesterase [Trueperaceae bacterium]|nr:bifunctional diguanylate cyclase/phosphodiesterase [Trueperaceae bacterium]